jgi:hypothetical protein
LLNQEQKSVEHTIREHLDYGLVLPWLAWALRTTTLTLVNPLPMGPKINEQTKHNIAHAFGF